MPDILFESKKADAALSNPLLMAHQPAMGLLFLTEIRWFHEHDAQVTGRLAKNASFAVALAVELVVCHAAVLLISGCD